MRKLITAAALAAFTLTTIAAGPAAESAPDGIDYELQVASGETGTVEGSSGTGGTTAGSAFGLYITDPADCGQDYENHCDKVLVEFTGKGDASFELNWPYPSDYDVNVFASDEDGTMGELVASSGNAWSPVDAGCDPLEFVGCFYTNEWGEFETKKGEFFLITVEYYAAGGGYTLDVSLA